MRRADSRRDFYAKALALFGLGLLGAIAAVVDNWPAVTPVSTAPATMVGGTAPAAPLRLDLRKLDVASDATAPAPVVVRESRRPVQAVFTNDVPVADTESVAVIETVEAAVVPSSISVEQGIPRGIQFASASLLEAPEPEPVVFIRPVEDHEYSTAASSMRAASVGGSVSDGFFSGAVKKTQDTLVKTGSTIADAFRAVGGAVGAVGGAVKRVMPF